MNTERRPAGPTWYGERRHSDAGITSVLLNVVAVSGTVTLVGGDAEGAHAPLVPELLAFANLVLRNPTDAAAVEIIGSLTVQVHGGPIGVAIDDDGAVTMGACNTLTVSSDERARYLAVAGGIESHVGLTSPGRIIEPGAMLRPGGRRGLLVGGPGRVDLRLGEVVRVRPGPDAARFGPGAFDALCRARCKVLPGGDRVALRLSAQGASFAAPAGAAGTLVTRGAIVAGENGMLLVAGPEHPPVAPTPVLALVDPSDLGRLAAHGAGSDVRFAAGQG
jgi:allophanate hydrolase subunit 2